MVHDRARFAAVSLDALAVETVFPDLRPPGRGAAAHRPSAVEVEQRGRRRLIDVSGAAWAAGVRVGMSTTEAKARCPELVVHCRDPAAEDRLLRSAAELLFSYGSLVEVAPPQFLFVEIGR